MARIHCEVAERIRIVRRQDFTQDARIDAIDQEHAKILRVVLQHRGEPARMMLRAHVQTSKADVRKITLHRLHEARRTDTLR
jgi:DNA-binding FadR family transcriptional regulator